MTTLSILVVSVLFFLCFGIRIVKQKTEYIVERFGKFHRVLRPGFRVIIPIVDTVRSVANLQIQSLDVDAKPKTKDNIFVTIPVRVQYIISDSVKATYELDFPEKQMSDYISNSLRATINTMDLDEIFGGKDEIEFNIQEDLRDNFEQYGFQIRNVLVDDPILPKDMENAYNDVRVAERKQQEAEFLGEAEKIKKTKSAEADASASVIRAEGYAQTRDIIAKGQKKSMEAFQGTDMNSVDAANFMITLEKLSTLKDISKSGTMILADTQSEDIKEGAITSSMVKELAKH